MSWSGKFKNGESFDSLTNEEMELFANEIVDSTARENNVLQPKTAPLATKKPKESLPQAVNFFVQRGNQSRLGGLDLSTPIAEAGDLAAAVFPSIQPNKSTSRNIAGGIVDALSAPGRVIASSPAIVTPGRSFTEAIARPGRREDQGAFAGFAEDVLRDPANIPMAMLGGPATSFGIKATEATAKALGPKISKALGPKISKALGPKISKALGALARSEAGMGVPMAVTGATRTYSDGRDSDILASATAPLVLAPVADATMVAGTKALKGTGKLVEKGIRGRWGEKGNPLYMPAGDVVDAAVADGSAIDVEKLSGLRAAKTINDALDVIKSGVRGVANNEAVTSPAAKLAKTMLRGQVKPAPMAKRGAESEGWRKSLEGEAGTKLFDQLTSYADLGIVDDAVAGMAERNLGKIADASRTSWDEVGQAARAAQKNRDDAIIEARRASAAGDNNDYVKRLAGSVYDTQNMPSYTDLIGIKPEEVIAAARALARGGRDDYGYEAGAHTDGVWVPKWSADEIARNRPEASGLTYEDVNNQLEGQYQRYLSAHERVKPGDAMDPMLAHQKKALVQKYAFQMGDPRQAPHANKAQTAAQLLSAAHNKILDEKLARFADPAILSRPIEPPVIRHPAVQDALGTLEEGLAGNRLNMTPNPDPTYDLQSQIITGKKDIDPEELATAIKEYFLNKEGIDNIRGEVEDKYSAAFPGPARMEDLARRINELLERRGQAPSQGPVSSAGAEGLSDGAQRASDAQMEKILASFRRDQIDPWIAALRKYSESYQSDVLAPLQRYRDMDKVWSPWYAIEPALQRAAGRSANKAHGLHLGSILAPTSGALLGAGAGAVSTSDSTKDFGPSLARRMGTGAGIGAAAGLAATRVNTPAGAKLVRDLGRRTYEGVTAPALKSARVEALLQALDGLMESKNDSTATSK